MSGFEIIAGLAGAAGTALQVAGTIKQGQEQKAAYQYQQKQDIQQANEARASSQRDAAAQYKQGRQILSQQRAAIAGSGGSIDDPSVIDLMNNTQDATNIAAQTSIYKGEQQARGYQDAATVAGVNAKNAVTSSYYSAAGSLFSGISGMYDRFGRPAKSTPARTVTLPYG